MEEENKNGVADTSEAAGDSADANASAGEGEAIDYEAKWREAEAARIKAEEVANNQKIRAEKAEKKAKGGDSAPKQKDISNEDIYALVDAKVPKEDVGEVKDYAALKGLSIEEALKTGFVKSLLKEKAEQRTSAAAAHTGNARRSSAKLSDDALLAKAQNDGELPDSQEDIERVIRARRGIK